MRLPPWLKVTLPADRHFGQTRKLLEDLGLATVCQSARCPNIFECFGCGTATFLLMGRQCTRGCRFCNIGLGLPAPLEADEPARVAEAAVRLDLATVVMTSVTRDDLPDGGAAHVAAAIRAVRNRRPATRIEVLIPDFQGDAAALQTVLDARPDCLNHNVETVPDCYPRVRPQASYEQSLTLLARAAAQGFVVKSGMMVGLSETDAQVRAVLEDLARAGVAAATIGQYLPPSRRHMPVARYVHPDIFKEYAEFGNRLGLETVSGPRVRSSYHAGEVLDRVAGRPGTAAS